MNTNGSLLPFVIGGGFLNSLNPCAIAVLLLFIALMFTLNKGRREILMMGTVYIGALFITYLGIGLGLLRIMYFFNIPNFMALVGGGIVIFIGLWGLKDTFFPGKFRILTISLKSRQKIAGWANRATLPAAAVTGILVGLTVFPCAGPIYLATLSLLSAKTTYLKGLGYLILYNLMFILPLILILIVTSNRMVTEKIINLNESNAPKVRLVIALLMITLGVFVILVSTKAVDIFR